MVELSGGTPAALNARARALARRLQRRPDVEEAVSGYASVTVHFDPDTTDTERLRSAVSRGLKAPSADDLPGRLHRIPVVYDGPDLAGCADRLGLAVDELVRLHAATTYRCFMLGFVPGWGYLGPLPASLRLARRSVPRTRVPAGSVAMAEDLTGVYPIACPGGWHLIGRTSLPLFLPGSASPAVLQAGDRVRFQPVAG